ncbi:ATP synthase mitochondrial F1 complex assembly factor 2-like [Homarus americanus]|uniref:ATP synthase mitochondrial F1 complex assembly factor 2-like n=1 Tax=Homarus americanus TaxID=6706 RepID=A0A8J5JX41_HOMAM|nr:ATP synthase mitochondrial F1 complex assembly factor 2-like [Homarus americanus]
MGGLRWAFGPQLLRQTSASVVPRRFLPEPRKRFYRNVTVAGTSDTYEVPNYGLALAIAHEWVAVKEKIHPSFMHLTGLANTVIDNPSYQTKWDVINKTLDYMDTDTVLFRDDRSDEFIQLQAKEWDPVLDWFNTKFEVNLKPCGGLLGANIPPPAREAIRRYLLSYNMWAANGFLYGVEAVKSVILTIAAAERKISAERAVTLSRLETNYQTSHWGAVEWAHDLEKYDLESRFSAALLFIHFNTWQTTVKQKAKQ